MPQTGQTFKNHTRLVPPFHFFVLPVLFFNVIVAVRDIFRAPSISMGWSAVVAAALLLLALLARNMAITVQNRVIRLEMRHRLKDTLPVDLHKRINELTPQQLIALRFAGDDEMPALVREVLAGSLTTQKAIKQRVKNWQGDYLRC
jgi:hypothetical protein